jgi:large subunit ribosomal protein L18
MATTKTSRREKIKKSIRKKISGSSEAPRLSVFRSNKEIYAQIIDDGRGITLASASSAKLPEVGTLNKVDSAKLVGKALAESALKAGIDKVVFDRNGYLYHGRVKSLAEGAREGGLKF